MERDIYCGPLTIPEIQKILSIKKPASSIARRHSIGDMEPSREIFSFPLTAEDYFMEDDERDVSFVSEYFTAQESNGEASVLVSESGNKVVDSITINSSVVSTDSDELNDTIEEMERLLQEHANLKKEENYSKSMRMEDYGSYGVDESVCEIDNTDMLCQPEEMQTTCNDNKTDSEKFKLATYAFKTPKPAPSKLPKQVKGITTPKATLFQKSPNYNNIISPVAMYVKHSARTPLVQHVPVKQLPFKPLAVGGVNKFPISKKESPLPLVTYKPTKSVVVSHESGPKLPNSINKFIPKPEVIKHEGRLFKKDHQPSIPEQALIMEDLTFMESSLLQTSSQDVSILAIKNAYK